MVCLCVWDTMKSGFASEVFADVVAQCAAEEAYEEGHRGEYDPRQELTTLVIFYAVEGKAGECGESSAEARHGQERETRAQVVAPAAIGIDEPPSENADQEASKGVYDPCGEAERGILECKFDKVTGDGPTPSGECHQCYSDPDAHIR